MAIVFSFVLLGQGETTSAILGQVNDPTNAPVWRAAVTVRSNQTGLKRTVSTDEAGRFNFPQLLPGSYTVEVSAQGFEREVNSSPSWPDWGRSRPPILFCGLLLTSKP